jgi:hypothetical protein
MAQKCESSVYCTIFDDNYLVRAIALYESLMRVNKRAMFVFFCIDESSHRLLTALKLDRALVVRHANFATSQLLRVKPFRSQGEYCWTCKPFALLYLMRNMPQIDWVAYVDTDMMFFSDPDQALPNTEAHYLLAPHRFHTDFINHERTAGKHNAGYVAARCSSQGQEAMSWWRDRCVESCSVTPTETTFADQKYLDHMLELFPFGVSSNHKGLNVAPWNVENFKLNNNAGEVNVDNLPLLLYHFQGLQLFDNGTASLYIGDMCISEKLSLLVYQPHLSELLRAFARLRKIDPAFSKGLGKQRKYLGNIFRRAMKTIAKKANVVPFEVI